MSNNSKLYQLYVNSKKGGSYRADQVIKESHYNDPIDRTAGRLAGRSRKVGDADPDVQMKVIDMVIQTGQEKGMSNSGVAFILSIIREESGFNPDAAAGTTTAAGLGQFINTTWKENTSVSTPVGQAGQFDAYISIQTMVSFFNKIKDKCERQGLGPEYYYAFYHDGLGSSFVKGVDTPGTLLSRQDIIPFYNKVMNIFGNQCVALPGWQAELLAKFNQASEQGSPLVLDLDGDGVELTGPNGVYWDIDKDGFREASAWVKSDDGLLARDVNGNGVIDDHGELFGDKTGQADGFLALATLDSNKDGKISAADAQFANLKVWRDLNQDGVSQAAELKTLAETGIASINLNATASNYAIAGSNDNLPLNAHHTILYRGVKEFTRHHAA
ncbi:MAG: transglycosylase SLT domain-containing protein [Alphaproteobacteria bacterium]|nr:MAG: transglycosylase SLT domain-containing protein [Alphaproteobacteria bacterium]